EGDRQRGIVPGALGKGCRYEAFAIDCGDRRQHLLVGNPRLPELGDQALHGGDVHLTPVPPHADPNSAASFFRVASWVRSRCSGVTERKPPRTAARSLSSSNSCSPGV